MSDRNVTVGPCAVEILGSSAFQRIHISDDDWVNLWKIVGPSASRNLDRLPLWKVIVCAYFEGLHHGAGLTRGNYDPQCP